MKKVFLILFILPFFCFAQKQGNIWYFQDRSGLDFNSGTPIALNNVQIPFNNNVVEGTAAICDSNGNLLFYATAERIWNRNHQLMPHGDSLMGGESSTHGVFIIPFIESDSLFYVITTDEYQNNLKNGLRYSVVDMCRDSGLGDIIPDKKNILLLDTVAEKLAATFHANDTDIWLVTHKYFSDAFYAYLITKNGISDTVITHIGSVHPQFIACGVDAAIGQMKISPDGSKLALIYTNCYNQIVELFDFNNSTGIVSNFISLPADDKEYGVAFSSDNTKLFISNLGRGDLYQFNLSSGNPADIIASKTLIIHIGGGSIGGLQLGPNGKIYVVRGENFMDVINNPNNAGTSCNYSQNAITFNHLVTYTLPSFIDSYKYKNGVPNCTTVDIKEEEKKEEISFYPNPATENITISLQNPSKTAHLSVYNILGKEIISKTFTGNKTQIDVSNLSKGLYLLKVEQDEVDKLRPAVSVLRFVKE